MPIVVVPAFLSRTHEPAQLTRCAAAVLSQPAVRRLVVVDDGSPLPVPPLPPGAEVIRQPATSRRREISTVTSSPHAAATSSPVARSTTGEAWAIERCSRTVGSPS